MKVIKKYKNRRIYDTDKSQYITFDDLKQYIDQDIDFKIVDSESGKDITNATLIQVIVEQEASNKHFLSKQMLKNLIKMSQHPMHKMMTKAFEESFDVINKQFQSTDFIENYQQMSEQWGKNMQTMFEQWQNWMPGKDSDKSE